MENLNAEAVKRGLECLNNKIDRDCDTCSIFWEARKSPITQNCRHIILDAALALITSQEQRIKELTEENERLQAEITHLEGHREADIKAVKNLKAENERLRAELAERPPKLIITKLPKKDQIAKEIVEGE